VRQIEVRIEGAVRIGRGNHVIRRGGRSLTTCHTVDQVVDADHLDVDVTARGVNQMVAANGRKVAIPRINHNVQLRVGQLQSGGKRDGAAMCGVE
jgi:hypothetical protein